MFKTVEQNMTLAKNGSYLHGKLVERILLEHCLESNFMVSR